MRVLRLLLLTFLFSLLLLGIQVLLLCLIFVVRLASARATGIGLVAGGWHELAWAAVPLVVVAAIGAGFAESYWRRRSAPLASKNRAPLL